MVDQLPQVVFSTSSRILHEKGEKYLLPVDEEEHERLRVQHEMLKEIGNGKVFFPPFDSSKSYSILDVGVGPGFWLSDVASLMSPSTILHGIDISSKQLPKNHPKNVSFSIGSVLSLPEFWVEFFDFVHMRLLVLGLKEKEWPVAIGQLYRALKPGGWVQLGEYSVWHTPFGPESAVARHKKMLRAYFKSRGFNLDINALIPGMLSDAGFVNVTIETFRIPMRKKGGALGADGSCIFLPVFETVKQGTLSKDGFGVVGSEVEYDNLINDVVKEWDEAEGLTDDFLVIYAQRPMTE